MARFIETLNVPFVLVGREEGLKVAFEVGRVRLKINVLEIVRL